MSQLEYQTQTDIRSAVRDFIVNNFLFGANGDSFADNDSLVTKGIIDSTGILELIEFLAQNYHIDIKDEEMSPENLDSIDNISSFVARKAGQR